MSNPLAEIRNAGTFVSSKYFSGITETKPRTAKSFELSLYVADGGVAHINDEHHEIRKGDIILASPKDVRHTTLDYVSKFVYFDTDDVRLCDMIASMPKHMHTSNFEKYSELFDELIGIYQLFDGFRELKLEVKLSNILCNLFQHTQKAQNSFFPDEYPEICIAICYIEKHYAEQCNVEKIAESCNMSESNFYKRFLKALKTTPNEYLMEYRIKKAKQLLVSDDISISKIAEKCGFNSQAYFCCCFKKREGISPGSFRKFYRNI